MAKNDSKQAVTAFTPSDTSPPAPGKPCLQSTRLSAPVDGGSVNLSKALLKKMQVMLKELLSVPDNMVPTKAVCDLHDQVNTRLSGLCHVILSVLWKMNPNRVVAVVDADTHLMLFCTVGSVRDRVFAVAAERVGEEGEGGRGCPSPVPIHIPK